MSTLVHSICRRTLVVGLVVASFAGASGSAYAASAAAQLSDGPQPTKTTGVVDGSLYGYANSYTPKPKLHAVSPYGYAMQYTPKAPVQKAGQSLYGYAMQYTPKAPVKKVPQRPKVVVERTDVLCDVLVGTAHAGDLRRCE